MAESLPRFSLVIPCYNESGRIVKTLESVEAYFQRQSYQTEIIVVDDGSQDDTAEIVAHAFPGVKVIAYDQNRGKGYAVQQGMLAARGEVRGFYDADGSTPIEQLEKVWPELENGAAGVIGSRALPESDIAVHQAWYREKMGRTYNLVLRALFLTEFPDTQCGFKCFTAACCDAVFPRLTVKGYGSDCELLLVAKKLGFPIVQVPVRWINSPDTRVNAVVDSLNMIREVLIIRVKALLGHYERDKGD